MLETQNMSRREFCLENLYFFFQLENEIFVLSLWWDNECDLLFGEDICSCGNAISKPVVFGWASITGGRVFPFAWERT